MTQQLTPGGAGFAGVAELAPEQQEVVLAAAETARRQGELASLVARRIIAGGHTRTEALEAFDKWEASNADRTFPTAETVQGAIANLRDGLSDDRDAMTVKLSEPRVKDEGGGEYLVLHEGPDRPARLQRIESHARTIATADLSMLAGLGIAAVHRGTKRSPDYREILSIIDVLGMYHRASAIGQDDPVTQQAVIETVLLRRLRRQEAGGPRLNKILVRDDCSPPEQLVWRAESLLLRHLIGRTELGRDDPTTVQAQEAIVAMRRTLALAARFAIYRTPPEALTPPVHQSSAARRAHSMQT